MSFMESCPFLGQIPGQELWNKLRDIRSVYNGLRRTHAGVGFLPTVLSLFVSPTLRNSILSDFSRTIVLMHFKNLVKVALINECFYS